MELWQCGYCESINRCGIDFKCFSCGGSYWKGHIFQEIREPVIILLPDPENYGKYIEVVIE